MLQSPYLLMGRRCMKLQYPPRVQVFSSYCRQVASLKSVTGLNSTCSSSRPMSSVGDGCGCAQVFMVLHRAGT